MKKTFIVALACSLFAVNAASAQSETYYGSQKGGFSIGMNAFPVLDYVGNMFNSSTDNYLINLGSELSGRYFVSDQWAVAAAFSMDRIKDTQFLYLNTAKPNDITDRDITISNYYTLRLGADYLLRPGKRLQPFVGLYAVAMYFGDAEVYEQEAFDNGTNKQGASTTRMSTPSFTYGAEALLGIEYFLGKQFSVSALMGLTAYVNNTKTVAKYKTDDPAITQDFIDENNFSKKTSKTSQISTNMVMGNVSFNFYF